MTRPTRTGGACLAIALLASACHSNVLNLLNGQLAFSSPDDPTAVKQPSAEMAQIDFGPVAVNTTKTLTLAAVSLGGSVSLGSLTPVQPDEEFSLPFIAGTQIGSAPAQIAVAFSPSSLGSKTASYSLAYTSPSSNTVTFELTGEGVSSGLSVAPNPVDFGNVELNQTQLVPLTITNDTDSSASLSVSSIQAATPSPFSLGPPSSTTLSPGASATLNAVFAPLVTGPASGSFTIAGAALDGIPSPPTTVNLGGTGVQSVLQISSPLDFGYVPPGETFVKSAVLRNAGSYATLHLVAPAPHITSGSSVFGLPSQPALPLAIAPGQTAQVPVSFAPSILGSYRGALSFATDDPSSQAPVIELAGKAGGPQILCISPLDFGPVPLGHAGSERTLCSNVGTDIPGDSDAGLRIAQADLATDNAVFVATLTLPDGGLAGSDFSVSLATGQSQAIEVTFRPSDAGMYRNRLVVRSSDLGDADAGIALFGEGIVPGPCTIELLPAQLNFGEIPSGDTGILKFRLEVTGQNLCLLTGISIDPRSDPVFSLPNGDIGYQLLSFPGNDDNPAGLPTSLTVDVQFAPTAAESSLTGSIVINIANATSASPTVSLAGSSAAACLTIAPPSYDFGLVGLSSSNRQICIPDAKAFVLQNACTIPVTVSGIDLVSGLGSPPQFSIESDLQVPLLIAPGGWAEFQTSFTPTGDGAALGGIEVSTSEFSSAPFLVTLEGDAETTGTRTDTFTATAPNRQLDILWVLDQDDDLTQVNLVANALPQLFDTLDDAGIDYQIAVTSTDTCDAGAAGGSDQGSFEPCDHCLSTSSPDPMLITPTSASPAMALIGRFATFDALLPSGAQNPESSVCIHVNSDEHFFDSIADAFSPALLSGHNSGFVRPAANLAVVVVNGDTEDDQANSLMLPDPQYLTTLAQLTTLLPSLKPDPGMVSVSYINQGGRFDIQPRMQALVKATGGVEVDSELGLALPVLFPSLNGYRVHLSSTPVGQIQVYLNGIETVAWSYDSFLNDIEFPVTRPPAPGSTITVTYDVGCP